MVLCCPARPGRCDWSYLKPRFSAPPLQRGGGGLSPSFPPSSLPQTVQLHRVIPVPPCVPHPVPPSTTVHHNRLHLHLTTRLSAESAHLPDRAFSPMTISLDGLRSAIGRPNGSLRAVNGLSYFTDPASCNFSVPSCRHQLGSRSLWVAPGFFRKVSQRWALLGTQSRQLWRISVYHRQ
jgi:hypothetical protein